MQLPFSLILQLTSQHGPQTPVSLPPLTKKPKQASSCPQAREVNLSDLPKEEKKQREATEHSEVQNEVDTLNEKANDEMMKVEQKYNKLHQSFFFRRGQNWSPKS